MRLLIRSISYFGIVALTIATNQPLAVSGQSAPAPYQQRARDLFRELIEINTTHSTGNTTQAANAMALHLKNVGFPASDVQVIGPSGSLNHNLVARLRGSGVRRPILFLAHLDVVEARRADWSVDPFTFLERDGYFYGRGTMDIKDGAAILIAMLMRLKEGGVRPDRDLIVALTAGEEAEPDYNGVEWLLRNRRDLIDAAYCINMDAGDPQMQNGARILRTVQASEKVAFSFRLEVKNAGGHSSQPTRDNAIYQLSAGLGRLAAYDFPASLNEVTRAYFLKMAAIKTGQVAADMKAVTGNPPDAAAVRRLSESPYYNALLRTTCVATEIEGGHAINALPQVARAGVNCRMLPGESPVDIERRLISTLDDTQIAVSRIEVAAPSPASPLSPEVMEAVERTTAEMWPGIPIVPVMETGATDGVYLRLAGVPTYGVSGVFIDVDDVRAHGKDERIGVRDYYDGAEYIYRLAKRLSASGAR